MNAGMRSEFFAFAQWVSSLASWSAIELLNAACSAISTDTCGIAWQRRTDRCRTRIPLGSANRVPRPAHHPWRPDAGVRPAAGTLVDGPFPGGMADLMLVRDQPDQTRTGYPLRLMQGADGVWRILEM